MKKDAAYSIRMDMATKLALKKSAAKDHRSMASLLEKIIADHLSMQGFVKQSLPDSERRKHPRKSVSLPGVMGLKSGLVEDLFSVVILNLSPGGILLTYPKELWIKVPLDGGLPGFSIRFEIPATRERVSFNCRAMWMARTGDSVRLGAAFEGGDFRGFGALRAYLR